MIKNTRLDNFIRFKIRIEFFCNKEDFMNICTAPVYRLKELNNIFIEMTAKNCNQRCKHCYIDFPMNKSVKDFIPIERIKSAIEETKDENLYCIYLTGAEPMTHPDFNSILRLCLKRCNVCICTNASFLNEKKVRFLSKVESESLNQIFFNLSLTHYNEAENDKVKYRGHFRQTIFALKTLCNYNFNSVLTIRNYFNLSEEEIIENFERLLAEHSITNVDIKITEVFSIPEEGFVNDSAIKTDCMYSRILTSSGVYSCPFLAGDYRGRCGSGFKDYSKSVSAETDFCMTCSKNKSAMFLIG